MSTSTKSLMAAAVVLVVVGAALWYYWDYVVNPWTRNGQVEAQVIQITPRVTGPVVELPIEDNQLVKKGDLLFRIDPRTYESKLHGAKGMLAETIDEIEALTAQVEATRASVDQYDAAVRRAEQQLKAKRGRLEEFQLKLNRYSEMVKTGAASVERVERAEADVIDAEAWVDGSWAELWAARSRKLQAEADLVRDIANRGAEGEANARLQTAKARVHSAELALEFTEVRAPVDGYVTNLNLELGDHATANKPALALIDTSSYWFYGFFREHYIGDINPGDRAIVTLMSYPGKPIKGRVKSKGWGVWQKDGSTAEELLPQISATFEWIRLAQRIPVRIEFDELPEGVELVVGATGSVLVMAGNESTKPVAAAPGALQ